MHRLGAIRLFARIWPTIQLAEALKYVGSSIYRHLRGRPFAGEIQGSIRGLASQNEATWILWSISIRAREPLDEDFIGAGTICYLLFVSRKPSCQPIRQRELREFPEDAKARRDLRKLVRQLGAHAYKHRRFHRAVLQPTALALSLGVSRRNPLGFCCPKFHMVRASVGARTEISEKQQDSARLARRAERPICARAVPPLSTKHPDSDFQALC
jgi:hypothetical protein